MSRAPRLYVCSMMHRARTGLFCLLIVLTLPWAPALGQSGLAQFDRDEIVIETEAGAQHRFAVELATTPQQQAQGLMFRRELPPDAGMLFVYGPVRVVSMWMRNTVIPLDMLFIDEAGRIEKVVERTVPMSLKTISSDRPVKGVLELNGGTAARLGLAPGDRVLYQEFADGS